MSLIDTTYFRNSISVPIGTYSDIQQYIDEYEKKVLIGLLGYDLYTEMMAAYAALPGVPLPAKWDKLINGTPYTYGGQSVRWNGLINSDKVSFIAYFVYCQYLRAKQFPFQTTGSVQPKNENSQVVDGIANHTDSWNKFVELYESCYQYLTTDDTSYPLVSPCRFKLTNNFGI
jgi:hypothetical protein